MRFAAIDVGTNSVHMVIADVGRDGAIDVLDRVKETVRLGRQVFVTGRLAPEAMELAVGALAYFKRLIELRRVEKVRAVATSAVREASNRELFVRRIRRETGIRLEVIPGAEEARLIFIASRHALELKGGPYLLVDIGGGSVELVLVRDGEPLWMRSLGLGAARLTEHFLFHDPPTAREVRRLTTHLEDETGQLLANARRMHVERAIGTSGTINAIVAMARAARGEELGRLHGASASAAEAGRIKEKVLEFDLAERLELPGMDAKRADLMPAAAIFADFVLKESGAARLTACGWALREGVLLELAGLGGRRVVADIRRHSVTALARRFEGANSHGRAVARLAEQLFDATASALGLPGSSRDLLTCAALLHDIGHSIDHERHNRHSYYLIKNAELFGFDPTEVEIIAQVARGHRKRGSRMDSMELRALGEDKRRLVRGLVAILRIADALDRSHFGVVESLKALFSRGGIVLEVDSGPNKAELELWACAKRTDLLARLLGRKVFLRRKASPRSVPTAARRAWGKERRLETF